MSSVRSISTAEDFTWSKPVKQGCLQVTRVTAEVAKLWNNCSMFASDEDGLHSPAAAGPSSEAA